MIDPVGAGAAASVGTCVDAATGGTSSAGNLGGIAASASVGLLIWRVCPAGSMGVTREADVGAAVRAAVGACIRRCGSVGVPGSAASRRNTCVSVHNEIRAGAHHVWEKIYKIANLDEILKPISSPHVGAHTQYNTDAWQTYDAAEMNMYAHVCHTYVAELSAVCRDDAQCALRTHWRDAETRRDG